MLNILKEALFVLSDNYISESAKTAVSRKKIVDGYYSLLTKGEYEVYQKYAKKKLTEYDTTLESGDTHISLVTLLMKLQGVRSNKTMNDSLDIVNGDLTYRDHNHKPGVALAGVLSGKYTLDQIFLHLIDLDGQVDMTAVEKAEKDIIALVRRIGGFRVGKVYFVKKLWFQHRTVMFPFYLRDLEDLKVILTVRIPSADESWEERISVIANPTSNTSPMSRDGTAGEVLNIPISEFDKRTVLKIRSKFLKLV